MLTADDLRKVVRYDPETGIFWPISHRQGVRRDHPMGNIKKQGYRYLMIGGRAFRANRLAWLYMTGEWPAEVVDHVNTNRADDRWINLRAATAAQNAANQGLRSDNTSGLKGAFWDRGTSRWRSTIRAAGKVRHLGLFDTAEQAHAAYMAAAQAAFGEFARAA